MNRARVRRLAGLAVTALVLLPSSPRAQGASADYDRAFALRERYEGAALNIAGAATWIGDSHAFWYRRSVKGGFEFIKADADTREKGPLFDHEDRGVVVAGDGTDVYRNVASVQHAGARW
jgi:hypothetical protein